MNNAQEDFNLTLFDRIESIKSTNEMHDLEHNGYISFSGGKDNVVLHYLFDLALPNNNIPRVFVNTGIEYDLIVDYVKRLAEKDKRIIIINSGVNIRKMLEEKGYPFKSKEHSLRVEQFNKGSNRKFIAKYLWKTSYRGKYLCPKALLYQFAEMGRYHYSNKCCFELKKKPFHRWQKENNRAITITGMKREEGGNRRAIKGCVLIDTKGKVVKFHPLLVVSHDFEDWFIKQNNIKLCDLYYPPYNFKRTGCKGCPFALDLQEQLEVMDLYLSHERAQCEAIWKPVYAEYRRLNYRLSKYEQIKLF